MAATSTKSTRPTDTQQNPQQNGSEAVRKPLYAYVGAADLAFEKLRELPAVYAQYVQEVQGQVQARRGDVRGQVKTAQEQVRAQLRQAQESAKQLPDVVQKQLQTLPERAQKTFDELVSRGQRRLNNAR